ncbi:MAG: hypothetical protein ABI412_04810 [Sphingomicrobium sp.]
MTAISDTRELASKVPAITLGFWIAKIFATTLGETAGDAVTMSWLGETTPDAASNAVSGYLIGSAIFFAVLIALVVIQIRARKFHPFLYWATIIASTTAGTTLADYATRSIGLGYTGGSALLLGLVIASLGSWKAAEGKISTDDIRTARTEAFYWTTITFSQTLGTALGDWAADTNGLGYLGGATLFGGLIALVALLCFTTRISRVALFWAAFILTRPLGATVGDFLDKPIAKGGLNFSRPVASAVLAAAIVLIILLVPQRAKEAKAADPTT